MSDNKNYKTDYYKYETGCYHLSSSLPCFMIAIAMNNKLTRVLKQTNIRMAAIIVLCISFDADTLHTT